MPGGGLGRGGAGLLLEGGLALLGEGDAGVLELGELGDQLRLLGGDRAGLGGGGVRGGLRGVAGRARPLLGRGRLRRGPPRPGVVATSARVAEARNTSYWPSSAFSAFDMVVARSTTVPMPSDFAIAEKRGQARAHLVRADTIASL